MKRVTPPKQKLLAVLFPAALLSPLAHAVDHVWTSGNFVPGATAPSPLAPPDTLSINAGSKTFSGISWESQSTVIWNADDIRFVSSSVTNSGLWDAKSDNSLIYAGGGVSSFFNNGTFRKSAGSGVTQASANNVAFVNSGIVEAQTGVIAFNGGSNTFNAGTQFTGAGINRIGNNATFNGGLTSTNLEFAGGVFNGGGTGAMLNGMARWTGGAFSGAWQLASGATLTGNAGSDKSFGGVTFTNDGTLVWQTTDNLRFVSSTVTNNNLVDLQADANLVYAGGGASNFVNTGTLRKSAGTSSSIGGNIQFINDGGVIDAAAGTIDFAGGNATFNNGTRFIGVGVNRVSNNATFQGGIESANLVLAGGTFHGGGSGAAISGTVDWTGGSFNNVWQVAAGAVLTGATGGNKTFGGVTFTNDGTLVWQTTDNLRFVSSTVTNNNLVDLQADANLVYAGGGASNFVNTGTLRKSAGTSSSIGGNIQFINDGGVIDAAAGTIDFAGGNATFNNGTRFIGTGINRISNNATFNGSFTSSNLVLAAGSFHGAAPGAILNGAVDWVGGSFTNVWQIAAAQTLTAKAGIDKTFEGVSFTNEGTVLWQSADHVRFVSSTFTNNSLVELQEDASLVYAGGGASNFVNNATGILRKSAGSLSSAIGNNIAFINNGGLIEAQTGTIDFAGGNATFNAGTRFTGAGTNRISNNATFNGNFTSSNLLLAGGTHSGGGSGAVLHGTVRWIGGTFGQLWQIAPGQSLIANAGTNKTFGGVNFTNDGTILWQTADNLGFVSSTLVNNGLVDLQDDASLVYAGGGASNFVNNGTLRKSAGAGASSVSANVNFTNPGTVDVRTGTFVLPNNFLNPGTIMGSGAVQTNVLTNAGHVAPGNSPGTLTLVGNYLQEASGTLDIELESLTSHDKFVITGTAVLNGQLALACLSTCGFGIGDEIVILDSTGDLTGTFANGPVLTAGDPGVTGFATGQLTVVYDYSLDEVRLRITQTVTPIPEPQTWAMLIAGLSVVGWAARRRRL